MGWYIREEVSSMCDPYELLSATEAAKELKIDPMTFREVLAQGTFPFPLGFWVEHDERRGFWIYRGLLEQAKAKIEGR